MIRITGGPPNPEILHDRLVMGWKAAQLQEAVERASQAIEARYRFKEQSR
jgi:hypothetical protein